MHENEQKRLARINRWQRLNKEFVFVNEWHLWHFIRGDSQLHNWVCIFHEYPHRLDSSGSILCFQISRRIVMLLLNAASEYWRLTQPQSLEKLEPVIQHNFNRELIQKLLPTWFLGNVVRQGSSQLQQESWNDAKKLGERLSGAEERWLSWRVEGIVEIPGIIWRGFCGYFMGHFWDRSWPWNTIFSMKLVNQVVYS